MSELDDLIDSSISVYTHDHIRYDGILFSINTNEHSIVLKDVIVLGTEDRVTDPAKIVPPKENKVAFITFAGATIADLKVHDKEQQQAAKAPPAPAPAKAKKAQETTTKPPPAPSSSNNNKNSSNIASSNTANKGNRKYESSGAGSGSHLLKMREKKGYNAGRQESTESLKENFDFEAGLNVFKKDEVLAKVAEEGEKQAEVAPKYQKDDFFDNMSCDLTAREKGLKSRLTYSEERSLNQDTFGAVALQSNNYRRHYGGRGRGGRGRGGRGRGGRNSYNSNSGGDGAWRKKTVS